MYSFDTHDVNKHEIVFLKLFLKLMLHLKFKILDSEH